MKNNVIRYTATVLATLAFGAVTASQDLAPIAESHTHYSWNQIENLPPDEAIRLLKENNVVMVVVASTPPELALKLQEAGGDWIVPIFSPYLTPMHRNNWFNQPEVLEKMEAGLASGRYKGVGEVHLVPGLGPRRDDPAFLKTIDLARQYDVPYLIHTDASSYKYLLPVCEQHNDVRFVWAHAGGILPPDQVASLLDACPNTMIDLTARDPLRYVRTPIADESGALFPEWRELVLAYPDRIMVGADAVWPVIQKNAWDTADSGWSMMAEFLNFHRRWLEDFPQDIQQMILVDNARRTYLQDGSLRKAN